MLTRSLEMMVSAPSTFDNLHIHLNLSPRESFYNYCTEPFF